MSHVWGMPRGNSRSHSGRARPDFQLSPFCVQSVFQLFSSTMHYNERAPKRARFPPRLCAGHVERSALTGQRPRTHVPALEVFDRLCFSHVFHVPASNGSKEGQQLCPNRAPREIRAQHVRKKRKEQWFSYYGDDHQTRIKRPPRIQ